MSFGGVVLIICILLLLMRQASRAGRREQIATPPRSQASGDEQAANEVVRSRLGERSLPLHLQVIRGLGGRLLSRGLKGFELRVGWEADEREIRVSLFRPRQMFYFDVFVPPALAIQLEAVLLQSDNGVPIDRWGLHYHEDGQRTCIRISLPRKDWVRELKLRFSESPAEVSWEVKGCVVDVEYRDFDLLQRMLRDLEQGHAERAWAACLEYSRLCDHNPMVLLFQGSILTDRGDFDQAGLCFLSAAATGYPDPATKRYQALQENRPWLSSEELQRLGQEADAWKLPEQHGVVVLRRSEERVLGLHGFHLNRCCETVRIRRSSAGRLLSNPSFDVHTHERLLFTRARCITSDGTIRELPGERFIFREDPEADPAITTRVERTGSWIMPDLEVGDVFEWSYDILCRERRPGKDAQEQSFIVSHPAHSFFPTLEGSVSVRWRDDRRPLIQISQLDGGVKTTDTQEGQWHCRRLELRKHLPRQTTGAPFHRFLLNPVVTCATLQQDWDAVARSVSRHCFGHNGQEEPLPPVLAKIATEAASAEDAMRRAFYWVRDNLKYAALQSSESNIGGSGRADSIVKAGVGDCKDRAYLLHLVAHHLGVPLQYLFVSTEYGVVFEEVPADQFDHVFVRAHVGGRWRYLDATNESGVFGSVNPAMQGMKALVAADPSEVIVLPTDAAVENTVEILEAFESMHAGRLCGTFHLKLQGNTARLTDCTLKRASLRLNDQQAAAQQVIRDYLPTLELFSLACVSETSRSDVLELAGTQRRCHLADLGSMNVGFVTWSESLLPLNRTLSLDEDGVFAFVVPMRLKCEVVIHGRLFRMLNSWSPPLELSNSVGTVVSSEQGTADQLSIGRTITVNQKYAEGAMLGDVKQFMDTVGRALQVAVAFHPGQETPAPQGPGSTR